MSVAPTASEALKALQTYAVHLGLQQKIHKVIHVGTYKGEVGIVLKVENITPVLTEQISKLDKTLPLFIICDDRVSIFR